MILERDGITDIPWFWRVVGNKVSHISSTVHLVVIMNLVKSQLRVLASHKTIFESVAKGS